MVINPNRILKIGRKNLILEVSDKLQVNDFYNSSGKLETTVHGVFSRINLCLIDTKTGKKSNAKIGKFNFCVEDISKLLYMFGINNLDCFCTINSIDPSIWQTMVQNYNQAYKNTNYNFLYSIKVNSYKKDTAGFSPVSKIKLSYETNMSSIYKWKINIEIGKGIANTGQYAFRQGALKQGTYQKLFTTFINISTEELLNILLKTAKHINLWEIANYPVMLENRKKFAERFKENNFNSNNLNVWNNNPNQKNVTNYNCNQHSINNNNQHQPIQQSNNLYSQQQVQSNKPQQQTQSNKQFTCNQCNYPIDKNIYNYSIKKFGRPLCFKCQSLAKQTM